MPQARWSAKRERQYDHIKEGLVARGDSEDLAQEIAARTVNKERARAGEAPRAESVLDLGYLVRATGRSPVAPGGGGPDP